MAFELGIADPEVDTEEIVQLTMVAYSTGEPFKSIKSGIKSKEEDRLFTKSVIDNRFARARCITLKIVETSSRKMVSFLMVQPPRTAEEVAKPQLPIYVPPGINIELFKQLEFATTMRDKPDHNFGFETTFFGYIITTHPDYRGQGHAKRLLEEALKMADREQKSWVAVCWPASSPVYRRLGFTLLDEVSVDVSKYNGAEEPEVVTAGLYKREPKPTVDE